MFHSYSMADTAIRLLRFLDPDDEEMSRLEELKLQAEHRARERSAERKALCPVCQPQLYCKTTASFHFTLLVLVMSHHIMSKAVHITYQCTKSVY